MDARSRYAVNSAPLGHGVHRITVQAVDTFGLRATSQVATISVVWPAYRQLAANVATNGEVVCCLGTLPGSNYVIEAASPMQDRPTWLPAFTNRATGTVMSFTNRLPC